VADTPMTRRDPEPAGARPTRRDAASGAAVTRRDEPVATPPPTRRDGAAGGASAVDFGPDTGGLPAPVYEHYQPVPAGSLGAGGEAHRVLRVRDRQTGVERVVKVYGSNVRPDPALLRALQNAHSPYLVEVIEWGDHTDSYGTTTSWEVLEYVAGGSLRGLIRRAGPQLHPDLVRAVLIELSQALTFLHTSVRYGASAGLAHRDIKPENVLVRRTDPVGLALCDFGLVAEIRATRRSSHRAGTAEYQAPETWRRTSRDSAQDWWSLGVLVVEMLIGRNPNAGADGVPLDEDVLIEHLTAYGVDLSGVADPRWRMLCAGLLAFAPEQRWTGEQVALWLDGGSPTVHIGRSEWPDPEPPRPVPPFEVAGRVCHDPAEVAAAMQADFAASCELFQTRDQRLDLADWIKDNFAHVAVPGSLFRTDPRDGRDAEARVARFVAEVRPDSRPSFRGRPVDAAGIAVLAVQADSDPTAARLLGALDGRLLHAFARHDCVAHERCVAAGNGCLVLEDAADRIRSLREELASRWQVLPDEIAQRPAPRQQAEIAVLRAVVDADYLATLRAGLAAEKLAPDCEWWAALRRKATGPAGDPVAVVLAAATVPRANELVIAARAARTSELARERAERATARRAMLSTRAARARGTARLVTGDMFTWALAMVVTFCVTEVAAGIAVLARLNPALPTATGFAAAITELQTQTVLPAAVLLGCAVIRPARPWSAVNWARWIPYLIGAWIGIGASLDVLGATDYPLVLRSGVSDLLARANAKLIPADTPVTSSPPVLFGCGIAALVLTWWVVRRVRNAVRSDASRTSLIIRRVAVGVVLGLFLFRAGQLWWGWQLLQLPSTGAWITL